MATLPTGSQTSQLAQRVVQMDSATLYDLRFQVWQALDGKLSDYRSWSRADCIGFLVDDYLDGQEESED